MSDKVIDLDAAEADAPDGPSVAAKPLPSRQAGPKDDAATFRDPVAEAAQAVHAVSRKIIHHESRHAAALRDVLPGTHPMFLERTGPDGRRYVVAGEVRANLAPIRGRPHATEAKAESVYRSAISDHDRSPEDNDVARQAQFAAQEARQEKSQRMMETGRLPDSPHIERPRVQPPPHAGAQHDVVMRNPAIVGAVARNMAIKWAAKTAHASKQAYVDRLIDPKHSANSEGVSIETFRKAADASAGNEGIDKLAASALKLNVGLTAMAAVVSATTASIHQLGDRLQHASPDVSMQRSINSVNRFQQDMQQAQTLGKPVAEFEKQTGRIDIAARDIGGTMTEISLPTLKELARGMAIGLEITADLYAIFARFIGQPLNELLAWPIAKLNDIAEMLAWFTEWVRGEEKPPDIDHNLAAFFGMQIPPGSPPPKLQGAFNMQIPNMFVAQPFAPVGAN